MKKILCFLMLTGMISFASAQVAGYTFNQSNGAFDTLTTGKILTPSTTSTGVYYADSTIVAGSTSTYSGIGLPIGFTFEYNGSSFDLFGINSNGWISFGKSTLAPICVDMNSSTVNSPISTTSIASAELQNRVSCLGRSLCGQSTSKLSYATIGTAPNRILVVEWMHYRRNNTSTTEDLNIQIKLYETTNIIEFVYGHMSYAGSGSGVQVGLRGQNNMSYNNRSSNTNWAATTNGSSNTASVMLSNTVVPDSGLTFLWTPAYINDAGITAINSPNGTISGVQDIAVTLKNFGTDTLFNVDIAWSVNGILQTHFTWIDTLPYLQSEGPDTIGSFNFTTEGNNIIKAWTVPPLWSTDENADNDTATVTVYVLPANDIAAVDWVTPLGGCNMSNAETVTARFTNIGSAVQSDIPVYYSINGGQTISGPETIAGPVNPGDTVSYTFTATADFSASGMYDCFAFSANPGDVILMNDSISTIITALGSFSGNPFSDNLESANMYYTLTQGTNSAVELAGGIGNQNSFGFHMTGGSQGSWPSGSSSSTTPNQAFSYADHVAKISTCAIDQSSFTNSMFLSLDLRMTHSQATGNKYSYFSVVANGTDTLASTAGSKYFNANTASADPFTTKFFDLSAYLGSNIFLEFIGSCKYDDVTYGGVADNIYLDNISLFEPNPPTVDLGNDTGFCAGSSMTLDAGTAPVGYTYSYEWSTLANPAVFATTHSIITDSAATYVVVVDNGYGQTSSDTIVVTEYALPVVTLGPDTANCPPITLDPGAGYSTYLWSNASTAQTIDVTTSGIYWVDVTNTHGCVSRDSVDVTINPLPVVNAGPAQTLCYLDTLDILSATASDYDSLLWTTSGDGHFNDSTLLNPYYVPGTNDIAGSTVNLSLTAYAYCDTVSSQFTLTITTSAIANAGTDETICLGGSVQLLATGGATYSWSPATGLDDPSIANPVASPTVSTTYTVLVTSSCGTATDDVVVTVNSVTPPDLGNDTAACAGNTIVLDAGSYTSYLWSNGEVTQTINVTTPGTYSVVVTGANLCTANDTVNIAFLPLPVVDLPADVALCGTEYVIVADSGYTSYLWNNTTSGTFQYTATATGIYFVNVTDSLGCSNYSDTIHVTLYPVYDLTVNPVICEGESYFAGGADQTTTGVYYDTLLTTHGCDSIITTNLTVKPLPVVNLPADISTCGSYVITAPAGFDSYVWNDSITGTHQFTATETGDYFVFVTDTFGCSNYSDTIHVGITPNPDIVLPDTTIPLSNGSVLLDAGLGFATYHWSTGATTHLIVVFANYLGVGTHHVYVTATAADGCASIGESVITVYQDAGIDEQDDASSVVLYPNPANDLLYINGLTSSSDLEVQVMDELGQIVSSRIARGNQAPYNIDVSGLAPGIYTIKFIGENIFAVSKFIKQ